MVKDTKFTCYRPLSSDFLMDLQAYAQNKFIHSADLKY